MPEISVHTSGRGRVSLPAYGVADAEHQVEKELSRAWPELRVDVVAISRAGEGRIVEEFVVSYRVHATVRVEAESAESARRAALRRLRDAFNGTRHRRIQWDRVQ
jgi:ribonuclease I